MPLDIGLGIFALLLVSRAVGLPVDGWTVALAAGFALLPDLDFIVRAIRRGIDAFSHEHRDLFHNPLVLIPAGFLAVRIFNADLACLYALCVFLHFLHDSIGMGWGVRWWYPFSGRYYKFFSDARGKPAARFLMSWSPEEQRKAAIVFGDPEWLRHYLSPSRELLIELTVFASAVAALFLAKM